MRYCPECGTKNESKDGVESKTCRRCGINISSAFKKTPLPNNPISLDDIEISRQPTFIKGRKIDDEYEEVVVVRKKKLNKHSHILADRSSQEMEEEEFDEENYDPAIASRLAQELKEGLNESDLIIDIGDGDIVRGVKFQIPPKKIIHD